MERIDQFKNDYSAIEITPHFTDYDKVRRKAREARNVIIKARADFEKREQYYDICRAAAKELVTCKDAMDDVREELNKSLRRHNREIIVGYATVIGVVLTFIGIVITGIGSNWTYGVSVTEKASAVTMQHQDSLPKK